MKNLVFVCIIAGLALAFYGQTSDKPNVWLTIAGVVLFMFGMMKLSGRTPSKHQDDDDIQ